MVQLISFFVTINKDLHIFDACFELNKIKNIINNEGQRFLNDISIFSFN